MKPKCNILAYGVCLGLFFCVLLSGCATVVSKQLLTQAQRIEFDEIIKDPDVYAGKVVVLSGIILDSKNSKEGTLLEVLQVPADSSLRPKDMDKSKGRFLALYKGFLDVAIYRRGREVTIGGKITGKRVLELGEIEYTYPFVEIKDIHLWPLEKKERIYYYPPPYLWHPWWYYYYPWW
ncbi:MAG: Slp family lipoprotein [Deltaproteobacteria bacterium]|nr:Slp family lipoprotein [Deltaproteobacteria bacterium]